MARPRKETADNPRLSVIDRRVSHPFGSPSRPIPLKPQFKNWVVRVFTRTPENPNRHYQAVHDLGWERVEADDLAVKPEEIGYLIGADGGVVGGEKGEHRLYKMRKSDFQRIEKAKSDANMRSLGQKTLRDEVAQVTAKEHGSEAGDEVHKHFSYQEEVGPVEA